MYLAKMKDNLCGAKYYYKNCSIYFNADYSLSDVDTFALHECLHFLQEQKDDRGNLVRLGLFNFQAGSGMALNEASVQLMTALASNVENQNVTYYNIDFPTDSIDCYPLECAIVKQMAYFTGTYPLFHSTIYSNDVFKNTFIALSSKETYEIIETSLDQMLSIENNLSFYLEELKSSENNIRKIKKINQLLDKNRNEIVKLFFKCQNTIISHCFSHDLYSIHCNNDIKELKTKIYNFKSYLGTNSTYEFYNEFYRKLMEALDEKVEYFKTHSYLETNTESTDLVLYKKASTIFAFVRKLFTKLGLVHQRGF